MTVEAALIVPAVWFCIGLLLALNFYVHNRVWYQAAAWEAVLAGNGREGQLGEADPRGLAEEKLTARLEDRIMPGSLPEFLVTGDGGSIRIRLRGEVVSLGSRPLLVYEATAEAESVRPAEYLRKRRFLGQLTGTE